MKDWTYSDGLQQIELPLLSDNPLVTIVVPSFNQGRFIERTLLSILLQDYRPLEIIVVDGASTDETISVLKVLATEHEEVRWLSEPDEGPADAVNKGLALARGEIIGIQSSDDMYYAGAIATAVQELSADRECGMIYGDSDAIDTDDRVLSHYEVPEFSWPAMFGISLCLAQQSIFFKTFLARDIGGWNGDYFGCDLDYWLRLMLRARAKKVPFTFSAWRSYPEQRTNPVHYEAILNGYQAMIADNQQLACAFSRIRRLADASCHLMALRFDARGSIWFRRWHAVLAFLISPVILWHCPNYLLKPLIPGYTLLRVIYNKVRPVKLKVIVSRVEPGMPRSKITD